MTVVEMHTAVNTQLHQIDSSVLEDFLPGEIDIYLNRGQLMVLKQKVQQATVAGVLPEEDLRTLIDEEVLYPALSRTVMPGNPVKFLITVSGTSGIMGIDIDPGSGNVGYDEAFSVDVATTVAAWLVSHTATLAALAIPIAATAVGTTQVRLTSAEPFTLTDGSTTMVASGVSEGASQFEYLIPYPDNYYSFVGGESGVTRTANPVISVKEYIPNQRILTSGQLKRYRITTYNRPYIREPRIFLRDDFVHILCDHETTIIDQRFVFVRNPDDIYLDETDALNNVNCELPDHVHDEVVEAALSLMVRDLNLTAPTQ